MSPPESARSRRKTFASIFPARGRFVAQNGATHWRIKGSGVSSFCENAATTKSIVMFLESEGINVTRSGTSGFCAADTYSLKAKFLDGGLWAETGNYIGGEKGAWITGNRAALLVALGLGLQVPQSLRHRFTLPDATLDELRSEASKVPPGSDSRAPGRSD